MSEVVGDVPVAASSSGLLRPTTATAAPALPQLRLYYQPIIDLADGTAFAHEGLLRQQLPNGNVLTPADFFGAIERAGQMPDVTRWVVCAAARTLVAHPGISLFVNLDRDSFGNPEILRYTAAVLSGHGIEPTRLGFEISEQTVITDMSRAAVWLSEAKQHGFALALDDFGGGEFRLEHILSLPVDAIKIDRLLTQHLYLGESPGLLKTLTAVAAWHAKPLILEGVATRGMVNFALDNGIKLGQGYHLGLPAPLIAPAQ